MHARQGCGLRTRSLSTVITAGFERLMHGRRSAITAGDEVVITHDVYERECEMARKPAKKWYQGKGADDFGM